MLSWMNNLSAVFAYVSHRLNFSLLAFKIQTEIRKSFVKVHGSKDSTQNLVKFQSMLD
jgi:hypothetical protein